MNSKRRWISWEENYVREHLKDMSIAEIAGKLGRTRNSVQIRMSVLGLTNTQRPWTEEDKAFITEHMDSMTDTEIALHLGRHVESVGGMRRRLTGGNKLRKWTAEEEEYLMDKYGSVSIPAIAKKLGRTVEAVKIRAQKIGLGSALQCGDYITLNQLMKALGMCGGHSYGYQLKSWVQDRGMPVHTRRVINNSFRVVYLDEFWSWAEKNRSFLDFSKMEPLALGEEPDWVPLQRKIDAISAINQRKDPWTPVEDQHLAYLLKQHKYTLAELSRELRRSAGAIQRRCCDLGLKERPVRQSPHNPWSDADLQLMADMIRQGYSYTMIGEACGGRSEKAIRGKVYYTYLTEDADKIRAMMGAGPWGHGAPEPTVKQGQYLTRTRKEVHQNLSILDALLRKRMNALGWDEYWQKDMCQHWDDIRGCLMKSPDCDSCTKFQRIRPQYCRMCGGEFLERREQTFCQKCRTMRKKQAQRKYAVLRARGRL